MIKRILRITLRLIAVVGILIVVAVLLFGLRFTIAWSLLVPIPALLAYLWLRRKGTPVGNEQVLLSITLICAFALSLIRGYTTQKPDTSGVNTATLEYSMGDLPITSEGSYDLEDPDQIRYVLFVHTNEAPLDLDIAVRANSGFSREGKWAISNTQLNIRCHPSATTCDMPEETIYTGTERPVNWNPANLSPYGDSFEPRFNVSMPLTRDQIHQRLVVQVRAQVTYPETVQGMNITEDVEREFIVLVGSPEEFKIRQQLNRWQALQSLMTDSPGVNVLWGGLLASVFFAIWGYKTVIGYGIGWERTPLRYALRDLKLMPISKMTGLALQPPEYGAYVASVAPNSVFAQGGLVSGSIILEVEDEKVRHPRNLYAEFNNHSNNRQIVILAWKDGETYTVPLIFRRLETN